jgi:hypothetical protein
MTISKDTFKEVVKLLQMTGPELSDWLMVSEASVASWRRPNGNPISGPVEVALRLEIERRGLKWPIEEN